MPHLLAFGAQVTRIIRVGLHPDGHLFDDFEPVTLQADDLARVIGQQTNLFETEVGQDLSAEAQAFGCDIAVSLGGSRSGVFVSGCCWSGWLRAPGPQGTGQQATGRLAVPAASRAERPVLRAGPVVTRGCIQKRYGI